MTITKMSACCCFDNCVWRSRPGQRVRAQGWCMVAFRARAETRRKRVVRRCLLHGSASTGTGAKETETESERGSGDGDGNSESSPRGKARLGWQARGVVVPPRAPHKANSCGHNQRLRASLRRLSGRMLETDLRTVLADPRPSTATNTRTWPL
jgi:hypothetical protein